MSPQAPLRVELLEKQAYLTKHIQIGRGQSHWRARAREMLAS